MKSEVEKYLYEKYEKITLTKKELALELSITIRTLERYIEKGKPLPEHIKIGGTAIFPIEHIAEFILCKNK